MKLRLTTFALVAAIIAVFVVAPLGTAAAPKPKSKPLSTPVTGTVTDSATGATQPFNGTFTITEFALQNGNLVATGPLADAKGKTLGMVTVPVTIPTATCPILNLVLGPVDLNLLGLTVHLNQVVLDITAVPGAGNLLGNLLCVVANLLNAGGLLSEVNILLGILNGLLGTL